MFHKSPEGEVLLDVGIGMVSIGLIIQVILIFLYQELLYYSIGLWMGIGIGFGMAVHMMRSIEDALDFGEEHAAKHIRKNSAARLFAVILIFMVIGYFQIGSMLTAFLGAMGLKISVYLQPYIYKLRHLRKGGG